MIKPLSQALCLSLLAVTTQAQTLLVANKSEASVTLFQLPEAEVVATLPTGVGPHEVGVSPDGRQAIVTDYGTRDAGPGQSLTIVDVPARKVLGTLALPQGSMPHGVEWIDNQHAVITAEGIASVLVVDVDAMAVTSQVAVNQQVAHMLALDAAGQRVYTANIGSGTATAVDLKAAAKLKDLPSGAGSEGIALARDGAELWVTNRAADTVTVFDTGSLEQLAAIPVQGFPIRAEADAARGLVYVSLPAADALVAIHVASRKQAWRIDFDIPPDHTRKTLFGDRLPGSSIPIGVQLSGDGRHLYVAHTNSHVVSVWDVDTRERVGLIKTGLEPDGMGWSPR
ncbi:hypothetical protein A3709_10800 [Halioglobus sp. HI00S01]|uniref:YVTN family beta-propeller repeat protein n=1 Tax=Halioglobus sp. HI00S01 TaxID=1822214 RepID=UPI0007C280E9|nr:cytochrome D1 domain-containing protein [Halioglobus sp. HI00S01]KZX51300.1 hypothetical protein A3709_10800 [Halioglobus sp. HI00S01]